MCACMCGLFLPLVCNYRCIGRKTRWCDILVRMDKTMTADGKDYDLPKPLSFSHSSNLHDNHRQLSTAATLLCHLKDFWLHGLVDECFEMQSSSNFSLIFITSPSLHLIVKSGAAGVCILLTHQQKLAMFLDWLPLKKYGFSWDGRKSSHINNTRTLTFHCWLFVAIKIFSNHNLNRCKFEYKLANEHTMYFESFPLLAAYLYLIFFSFFQTMSACFLHSITLCQSSINTWFNEIWKYAKISIQLMNALHIDTVFMNEWMNKWTHINVYCIDSKQMAKDWLIYMPWMNANEMKWKWMEIMVLVL